MLVSSLRKLVIFFLTKNRHEILVEKYCPSSCALFPPRSPFVLSATVSICALVSSLCALCYILYLSARLRPLCCVHSSVCLLVCYRAVCCTHRTCTGLPSLSCVLPFTCALVFSFSLQQFVCVLSLVVLSAAICMCALVFTLREIGWGGMDWIDMAQNRDHWRALMNTVMNLRVS
jgi:hypothetical protein